MNLFGETIFLPKNGFAPQSLAYIKRLHTAFRNGLVVKVYYNKRIEPLVNAIQFENPILVKVLDCYCDDDIVVIRAKILPGQERENEEIDADTSTDIIVEVDPVKGKLTIPYFLHVSEAEQDEIIERIRQDPGLLEKVPPRLWDDTFFQMKFLRAKLKVPGKHIPEHIKSLAKIEKVNYFGRQTRNFRSKLPDEINDMVGDHLGFKKTPKYHFSKVVNESDRRQGRSATCTESDCPISGGRRTRRFKK